jgi:hypothetical protein
MCLRRCGTFNPPGGCVAERAREERKAGGYSRWHSCDLEDALERAREDIDYAGSHGASGFAARDRFKAIGAELARRGR